MEKILSDYEKMMEKQPKILYCPSCKSEIEKIEMNEPYKTNGYKCSKCDMIWNIQYMKFKLK